jgi:hypothetical protein
MIRKCILTVLGFLLAGAVINIVITFFLAWKNNFEDTAALSAAGISPDYIQRTVNVLSTPTSFYLDCNDERGLAWSPQQAVGPPDATPGTDDRRAWASQSADGSREWITLTYPVVVIPAEIHIHESYSPGAVDRITLFTPVGEEIEVWSKDSPAPTSADAFVIPVKTDKKINRVKIYLDSPRVPSWNEIDAVGLVDANGKVTWASQAQASSFYGSSRAVTTGLTTVDALLPTWSELREPSKAFADGQINQEIRAVKAFGFPMLSLWTSCPPDPALSTRALPFGSPWSRRIIPIPTAPPPPMPVRPIFPGFAVNTVVYSIIAALLAWLLNVPRRFIQELSWLRHGRCIRCGYELGYDFAKGCPECGWRRGPEHPPHEN